MSSFFSNFASVINQKITCPCNELSGKIWKSLAISGLVLLSIYVHISSHPSNQSPSLLTAVQLRRNPSSFNLNSPTKINHIVFGIAGLSKTWYHKRWYVESWWRPNVTRGYLFLDTSPRQHFPWPSSSPPLRVSEDISKYDKYYTRGTPFFIRILRVIEEVFHAESEGVRWYVMGDDDTVFLVDNLVEVLSKYDHTKYFYIGMPSECVVSNFVNSFEMAFGGAGYALSYPLAKAVAKNMDLCIKRYTTAFASDFIMRSCIADLGVPLTKERGFHQIDLHRDISGLLSSHPHTPLLSLHHIDAIDPIFPSMNRPESLQHLMKAAKVDQSRLLQQSVCYYKKTNWTFSVSWGYSVHIYEEIIPPSILHNPIATFIPWKKGANLPYMFNSRPISINPCEAPQVFFFEGIEVMRANYFVTSYAKKIKRGLGTCLSNGNHSAEFVSKIYVLSPMNKLEWDGSRRECCDVEQLVGMDSLGIKLRACMKDEIVA
ncbi:hypothetical protein ACH5RR_020734 [Cinchona calisaya]|uniref:Uncharacterized protein n=1 Tax=Cinchona calisaya TaxID=153742 RepID=A0ABD2ZIT5_9GENT